MDGLHLGVAQPAVARLGLRRHVERLEQRRVEQPLLVLLLGTEVEAGAELDQFLAARVRLRLAAEPTCGAFSDVVVDHLLRHLGHQQRTEVLS